VFRTIAHAPVVGRSRCLSRRFPGFPWTYLTKDITFLYRTCMWVAFLGVRVSGVKVRTLGLEKIDPARTYIFMSNHISNLDPPITLPLIPRRTSVMVKKELFKVPILARSC
jgi:1-acyl-sn-glycerol-3-phosphate acyltransferase